MNAMARRVLDFAWGVVFRGRRYQCPICERRYSSFLPMDGVFPSYNALCPGCHSLERHRILWRCLSRLRNENRLKLEGKLLHVAPEPSLARRFRKMFDYLSVDFDGSKAMMAADITKLNFPNNTFDAIVCNHVLEHIPQDRLAMSELFRVLKPGGWASVQVPRTGSMTDEDPSVIDPHERTRRFGQDDHVRLYGQDYFDRLRDAGFRVTVYGWKDCMSEEEAKLYVIPQDEEMIFAWKDH